MNEQSNRINAEIILVGNQKGGVQKSSATSAVAGELASTWGRKVLVVDGDLQGNATRRDLGIAGDSGLSLAMAMQHGLPLAPVQARENLDVIPGGVHLAGVPASMAAMAAVQEVGDAASNTARNLGRALADLVDKEGYTEVLIDSGPGDVTLLNAYLSISNWLVIPTHEDEGSIDGVKTMWQRLAAAQDRGSNVDLLGVVLTGVNNAATRRNAAIAESIDAKFGHSGAVFTAKVRHQQALAIDLRSNALIPSDFHSGHFARRVDSGELRSTDLWARSVNGLVSDYQALTKEVLTRIIESNNALEGNN